MRPRSPDVLLTAAELETAVAALHPDWEADPGGLVREVEFADFPAAVRFVDSLVEPCEAADHHPDLAVSWRRVTVTLVTHSAGGITARDAALARLIDPLVDAALRAPGGPAVPAPGGPTAGPGAGPGAGSVPGTGS